MITIDCTHHKIVKYEIVVTYHELMFRIIFNKYMDARSMFTELTNERINGMSVWLNDLATLPDC